MLRFVCSSLHCFAMAPASRAHSLQLESIDGKSDEPPLPGIVCLTGPLRRALVQLISSGAKGLAASQPIMINGMFEVPPSPGIVCNICFSQMHQQPSVWLSRSQNATHVICFMPPSPGKYAFCISAGGILHDLRARLKR